ncbi:Gluconate 2-dehydrogenase subunit 3 [Chitinophaga sp. CF118]|uniref:gluconate 2-dehydrogenase subunit 3 family protein n=1 Tax=Chitinophaga sp. CF118 TaxID=1884367 RepID=UPI0008E8A7D6|nr:gluconate 2-dehydrogenase subunit 3 family protein [Chitinophaga sp. CF118]SFD47168.1 Gluconate 2-dehydrogenase subunit 3 [Chitinophaga sp. CF118]
MPVSRRTAIKQVLLVSAGIALLPSCLQKTPASVKLKNIDVDGDDEKMLAELTATIIPTTTTPGAKEVSAHLFTITMIDDCFDKERQQKWLGGMRAFEELCKKTNGHSFVKSTSTEKEVFLKILEREDPAKVPAAHFYQVTKRLTIQAYTSSEYYLTKVEEYELVPARFHGSIPVKDLKKKTL